jgi:type IV secretory pathway VirB10-like protein
MGFFEEHKALIITVLLFSVLLLAMYNINISESNRKTRETLIELSNLRREEPKEQQQQEEPTPPEEKRPNLETHQAFNENREESEKEFNSRLDEIFKKNAAQQEAAEEDAAESSPGEYEISQNPEEKDQQGSQGDNSSKELSASENTYRNSSISFSLVGRKAIEIPNPIYTCDSSGKIVVNIEVNSYGDVLDAKINKSSSTSSNECLIDQAIEYALGARFSRAAGRNKQPGTITFYFQD